MIPAPPPTCGFPIFSHPTSVIVITSGQAGARVFVSNVGVNHWGGRGVQSVLSLLESIFIKSVASRANICSSLHAMLSFRLGVQMCGRLTSHYETLRGNTFFFYFFLSFTRRWVFFCAFVLDMLINGTPRPHYANVLSFMARPARAQSESSKLNAKVRLL